MTVNRSKIPPNVSKAFPMIFAREWLLVVSLIFGGCCTNVLTLEFLTKHQSQSGVLVTFAQFLFLSLEGLISHTTFINGIPRLKERKIPIKAWITMVLLFWGVSVLNNYALGFNIPMTLHIIFRSLGLLVTMINGYLFFNRRFSVSQILSVSLVTLGVTISTFSSYGSGNASGSLVEREYWIGLLILSIALILSSFLGQYQQTIYAKYGKHWKEGLFYIHFIPLIGFGIFYNEIQTQCSDFNSSPLISIGATLGEILKTPLGSLILSPIADMLMEVYLPKMWFYLLLNCVTQCICY